MKIQKKNLFAQKYNKYHALQHHIQTNILPNFLGFTDVALIIIIKATSANHRILLVRSQLVFVCWLGILSDGFSSFREDRNELGMTSIIQNS